MDAKSKEIDKLESVPEFIRNLIDQASKTQKTKKSAKPIRRMYFHFSSPDNGCDRIRKGKIMNKPQQNLKSPNNLKPPSIFNISRGGNQDFNGLNISQISEELNIENERWFIRLGKFLVKNRKKISLNVICGAVLCLILKKRIRVRKILHKIRQISKHWVFTNCVSRGVIVLCKYNLKYNKI